jgi:hypothetical protein
MITTLKPTSGQPLHTTGFAASAAPMAASTATTVPESRSNRVLPYAIGALLGLLVVLALAAWAYLLLRSGDYSGAVDLMQPIER